jgi:AcrR family transcriptional regulator
METSSAPPAEHPLVVAASLAEATGEVPAELPRHRHALTREAVRASQVVRILLATADVVAERGYAATSVSAIAGRAGVSTKTFYELYGDKEEAFLAAYAAIDVVIARMTEAALAHEGPPEMLRAGARSFLDQLAGEPAFTRMLVIEAVGAGPRVLRRRAEAFADFVAALRVPLDAASARDPGFAGVEEPLLLALLGGINELVLEHLVEREPESLGELAPTVEELIERVCFP